MTEDPHQVADDEAQPAYDRINRSWRIGTAADKAAMIGELRAYPSTSLGGLVAKLIDEIQTELDLETVEEKARNLGEQDDAES